MDNTYFFDYHGIDLLLFGKNNEGAFRFPDCRGAVAACYGLLRFLLTCGRSADRSFSAVASLDTELRVFAQCYKTALVKRL